MLQTPEPKSCHPQMGCYSTSNTRAARSPMLPPFIIDQIRKREEEEVHPQQQPTIELPLPRKKDTAPVSDDDQRGLVVIDLF